MSHALVMGKWRNMNSEIWGSFILHSSTVAFEIWYWTSNWRLEHNELTPNMPLIQALCILRTVPSLCRWEFFCHYFLSMFMMFFFQICFEKELRNLFFGGDFITDIVIQQQNYPAVVWLKLVSWCMCLVLYTSRIHGLCFDRP